MRSDISRGIYRASQTGELFFGICGRCGTAYRFLRGHTREMQGEIADSIRIYIVFQEIDLTGVRHVDDELEKIFEMYDNLLTS
jgi:hypothetical protein